MNSFENMMAEQMDMLSTFSEQVSEISEVSKVQPSTYPTAKSEFSEVSESSNESASEASESSRLSTIAEEEEEPSESQASDSSEIPEELVSKPKLIPGIIVMNRKYFIDLKNEAPKNGDMPFVMAIIQVLQKVDAFLGMILYERTEQRIPKVTYTSINSVNCAVIAYNPQMYTASLMDSVAKACKQLSKLASSTSNTVAILYHQDERLLEVQPRNIPFAITHHGPIIKDVIRHFPDRADILDAFGTDIKSFAKVTNLQALQESGLKTVRTRVNGFVLAMSELQSKHFVRSGVDPQSIIPFPPPLHAMLSAHSLDASTKPLFGMNRKYFLFTAVARLTWFKHAELLIDGAILLFQRGLDLSLFIAGGDESPVHVEIRKTLLARIPTEFLDHVNIVERMPQEELYTYLSSERVQSTGIFACSSRYETLGITPLEAALSGVTTVITDTALIEATRYFPEEYRFKDNPEALADRLETLFNGNLKESGQRLKEFIKEKVAERGDFETEFWKAWSALSGLSS